MTHSLLEIVKQNQLDSFLMVANRWISEIAHGGKLFFPNHKSRRLAGIFYADVTNYTGLTEEDEEGTHAHLMKYMDLVVMGIHAYHGKVVHFAGDAILAEFGDLMGMLTCAMSIQHDIGEENAGFPLQRRVEFRIGINLGEVISDRGDVYGNTVNVAVRLESLAEPGGITVSDAVRVGIGNRLPLKYISLGEQWVKNINAPVRAYRLEIPTDETCEEDRSNVLSLNTSC